jgi:WD40 repeat protein
MTQLKPFVSRSACHADSNSRSTHREVIKMWDVEAGKCLYTINSHTDLINAVEFSPKGELFVSCSDDGLLIVWDVEVSSTGALAA